MMNILALHNSLRILSFH